MSQLTEAVQSRDFETVRSLVEEHPELVRTEVDSDGMTPLHFAIESGNQEIVG